MARIGVFPFLGRGHLDPISALCRRLVKHGHEVMLFHLTVAGPAIRRAGLRSTPIDRHEQTAEPDALVERKLRPRHHQTVGVVSRQVKRVLREGADAVSAFRPQCLLIDHMDFAASSIAHLYNIPYITLSPAAPLWLNDDVPPSYFGWSEASNVLGRIKVKFANHLVDRITAPILVEINEWRRCHGLNVLGGVNDTFSTSAIITQMPRCFDLPRRDHPRLFHTGPFADDWRDPTVSFPWSHLDGKPLIFASLGTVRNNDLMRFQVIAEATSTLNVQLILSLGGGRILPSDLNGHMAGNTIVVDYAPQRELLANSALAINCAGLNTTLDCISAAVPMVVTPLAEDQPGVAVRIRRAGIGAVVWPRRPTVTDLRTTITQVLDTSSYLDRAKQLQQQFAEIDGIGRATKIINESI